jgi:transposase
MAYFEIKRIKGREYKYLRQSVRLADGRVVHKNAKYMGPVEPCYKISKERKDNSWIFVRKISKKVKNQLEKDSNSQDVFTRERARIIICSSEHLTCLQIAEKIGCDVRKVRRAIKEFNEKGLICLVRKKAKGAKVRFDKEIQDKILAQFSLAPLEFGHCYTVWTLPRFRKHLMEQGVVDSISIETLRQMIMERGAKLKKSKRWQYSPDKEFLKKSKQ